ncbi:hypothetical protein NQ317_011172 [Molorchus minor]|uniref:Major facilitator superfamily (MFS) profile domain-containing protein n=1 Tax=Molorchus minor TaxID=1323400 RepID=A0ABQ9J0G9_9CUCU|nr:hypothetical protein NQ317_011172 [Molorchus minor]
MYDLLMLCKLSSLVEKSHLLNGPLGLSTDVIIWCLSVVTRHKDKKMDTNMEVIPASEVTIKVYKYRWVAMFIFCLFTIINFMQFLQFTIIANVVTKYYGVKSFAVDLTGLIFFLAFILLFSPISYLIEKYSLKVTAVVSTGLTLLGNLVKLLCADPNRFYVVLIGQAFCAIGQVYMMSIPSKFASVWFGANEVSTACAIAVLGTQLGAAIGSVVPPLIVKKTDKDVGESLRNMMIYNAILSVVVFIIVAALFTFVLVFRSRPKLPPSQSQLHLLDTNQEPPSFLENFKTLIKNRDFLLLLLSFGLFNGLWNSFGILINTLYINYFPDGESDVGVITLIAIISGGCIGSLVFGLILDKTHQFKKTASGVMLLASATFISVVYTFLTQSRIGTYITIPIFGFFAASGLVISFEYSLEVTYPIPESVSCSILNATAFLFAIICSVTLEWLLDVIGYVNSFIIVLAALLLCPVMIFFISSNLRRRDANLAHQNNNLATSISTETIPS